MKYSRLLIILALAVVVGLTFARENKHVAAQDQHGHAAAAESEHGEKHDLGTTLVHILEHHLVDSDHFELFGWEAHLPTIKIGGFEYAITKHRVWWIIALGLMGLVVWLGARQRTAVPSGLRNALEGLVVFIRDEVVKPNLHEKTDAFMPYFLTLFTGILFSNLLGLLPWGTTSTGNVNVTCGLSLLTLGLMVGMGVKENGLGGFLHSFAPPGVPMWLMPLMIIIEIVSFLIRPFALTIRLFANMLAGHAVFFVLLGLILSLAFAVPALAVATGVFLLEIIVALIQSYIFIMLTATFMGLTMHPAH
ncbi:MAG: F0F1 ATP synthase subunit A [Calditrichaeota bacterium]|nr:F0F1 ATP synthase subunit A [Calditrichota bacterium]MCB9368677.1 F0F1 ATP synthase subunit A [Calditrichota bacterium]